MVAVSGLAYYTLLPIQPNLPTTTISTYTYTANLPCFLFAVHSTVVNSSTVPQTSYTPKVPIVNSTVNSVFCLTYRLQFDNYSTSPPSNLTVVVPKSFNPVKLPDGFYFRIQGSVVDLNYPGMLPNPAQFTILLSPSEPGSFQFLVLGKNIGEIPLTVAVRS
jgi:hypothetical protein